MEYQPESNRLLYAQLLADCSRQAAPSGRGLSFVSKTIRGARHWYLQVAVGASKTQHYLGPDSEALRGRIAQERALWARAEPDRTAREKLVAMLVAGGAATVGPAEARVLELLERAGVFLVGGAIVGSHAFGAYANMLGVRWESETLRTQDVDLAAGTRFGIGVSASPVDLHRALLGSGMGFFEVPALDRKHPSTRYTIRGRQLSVDLLTPMRGRTTSKPVRIDSLGAAAEPVRFLDYLLDAMEPAVIVARAGILINVPAPARFAMHKLVTAQRRPAATQTKGLKDIAQARQLLDVLLEDRPGDLALAWEAAQAQPPTFRQQLRQGMNKLSRERQQRLQAALGL